MLAVKGRLLAVGHLEHFSDWASEPPLAEPPPARQSAAALALCQERTRGRELATKSIGPRIAIAWQDRFASGCLALY